MRYFVAVLLMGITAAMSFAVPSQQTEMASLNEVSQKIVSTLSKDLPQGVEVRVESVQMRDSLPKDSELVDYSPRPAIGVVTMQFQSASRRGPVYGTAVVKSMASVAVAKTGIRHGEMIQPLQIRFERRELTPFMQTGYYLKDTLGSQLRARGYIRPGAVLTAANTEAPMAVERGQVIDLITRKGSLVVTARVKALERGRINDWIQVENMDSRRILSARIARDGEAETK